MKTYRILGLMSGTSLDGLDLAYCELTHSGQRWDYEILASESISYQSSWKERLKHAIFLPGEDLMLLNIEYGNWLGDQARQFLEKNGLVADAIASHGHTAHHRPEKGLTVQLGSGQHLATTSGIKTICDFRTLDVALGGQGAPLVPIGDRLLFGAYDFCLNLGGISNISFEWEGQRIAYDIGLANMLLNHLAVSLEKGFDENGNLARKGKKIPALFDRLNNLEYHSLPFPKSTGYEWFLQEVIPLIDNTDAPLEDLLHTGVQHICEQVVRQVQRYARNPDQRLLVTGGGALNKYLTEVLGQRLSGQVSVVIPERRIIEFKEALVFALMGVLRMEGATNVLHSVTGASRDSCSGVVYLP